MSSVRAKIDVFVFPILGLYLLGIPVGASACGVCVFSQAWYMLPPIIAWSLLSIGWYISLAFLANRNETNLFLIPIPSTAIGLGVVGSVLGGVLFGPITMIPLAVPCLVVTVQSLSASSSPRWPENLRGGVRWTGGVALGGMLFFAVYDMRIAREMDTADKIMAWHDSSLGRMLFTQLEENEPESLDQYRKLMREANGYILWLTAKRMAEVGKPKIDVPILIEALASERSADRAMTEFSGSDYGMEREFIEEALRVLTGLSLPEKTPAEEWKRQWERRLEQQ